MNDIMKNINGPLVSQMMSKRQIYGVIYHLNEVLSKDIEGDIVELGCLEVYNSIFIRKWLDKCDSSKRYHVYDSWEGLPEKLKNDVGLGDKQFYKGDCKTSKESFIYQMNIRNLSLPEIHSGWFKDIPDDEYPDKICFAFLDGDFYSSIKFIK